jgi:hypothetical protein
MKKMIAVSIVALCSLIACSKSSAPAPSPSNPTATPKAIDGVQQKLQEYSGTGAIDCGRLDVHAPEVALRTASDCALQSSQAKRPFYVAYDMPGMTVGVAGNAEGKLFTVQLQGEGAAASLTSGACPSQLRVASSGRVTCFAPGDMSWMSSSHAAGAMPPGIPNPHAAGGAKPPGHP